MIRRASHRVHETRKISFILGLVERSSHVDKQTMPLISVKLVSVTLSQLCIACLYAAESSSLTALVCWTTAVSETGVGARLSVDYAEAVSRDWLGGLVNS